MNSPECVHYMVKEQAPNFERSSPCFSDIRDLFLIGQANSEGEYRGRG